ncbi:Hypothetical protein SCF082_LOCUS5761 [Durusdinium trenchii]|uniref:Uncharacterized protein n=1 Tax=Durusdinium trenchii TaxID=1381693 RepID=A0ABP0I9S7_9DINO
MLKEHGINEGRVVETEHPYAAKSILVELVVGGGAGQVVLLIGPPSLSLEHPGARWSETVRFENAKQLQVSFSNRCRTYDSCASVSPWAIDRPRHWTEPNWGVHSGSLSKANAGVGARVQVQAMASDASIHGTLTGRLEGQKWSVRIDHDEAEISSQFREWLEADPARNSMVTVAQEVTCVHRVKVVEAYYEDGLKAGDEIHGFHLDMSSPMTPFSDLVEDGVMVGWYLDVDALIQEESFQELEAPELGPCPTCWEEATADLQSFQKRLDLMLREARWGLCWCNGLDFKLLPGAHATYDKEPFMPLCIYLRIAEGDGLLVTIGSFKEEGPAQQSGAREGWQLNLVETFKLPSNQRLSRQQVLEDPEALLTLGIELRWETDGDGSHSAESRWGFFALVTPDDGRTPLGTGQAGGQCGPRGMGQGSGRNGRCAFIRPCFSIFLGGCRCRVG